MANLFRQFIFAFIVLHVASELVAQLPQSNIYLCSFEIDQDSMHISDTKYLTNFNSSGYNNQPYFLESTKLLISSNYLQSDQTDIFLLNLENHKLLQVTDTDQSEYSPTLTPDGKHFSVIRVEPTQNNAQYLWQYPLDRKSGGFYLFKELITVGYHCWLDPKMVAMFLVDTPFHKLVLANSKTQQVDQLIDNIGRTLLKDAEGNLNFVHKISNKFWYIKSFDPETSMFEFVCRTIDQKEDFAILEDGSFIMASTTKLFRLNPKEEGAWKEVFDFAEFGVKNITRLRVYQNKLAFVTTL